jgi:hypothetical protein
LGLVYCQQGQIAEAALRFQRSLTIAEQVLGPDHRDVARSSTLWGGFAPRRSSTPKPSRQSIDFPYVTMA